MLTGEDEAAVAVIAIIAYTGGCKAGFYQLALQILGYGTAPASVEEDVAMDSLEISRGQRGTVIPAEGEGLQGKLFVL